LSLRPRLFTRPWPVLACALLAVNDHLLKGSGMLPGWVTGKLSDLAGMFFAPLLLAELWLLVWPARSPEGVNRRLGVSALLVGMSFSAINLSVTASTLYERVVGWVVAPVGLRLGNVVDPTDLVALPMIGLALWYGRVRTPRCSALDDGGEGTSKPLGASVSAR
jgi:hypothetical protein